MNSIKSPKKTIILTVLFLLVTITASYANHQTTSGTLSSQVGTDPNTGAANVSVPIEVPPGRNGMAPNLALSYNSNKRNGWIGVGWDIKTSFIQRNTKLGLDYTKNDYVADGNKELVQRGDWGTDYYGHKTEGAFIKYYYNGVTGGWEATTKNGTKHYYGTTAASRQDNPNNSSEVFKWMIDKVEDTNGSYVTYTYTKDQGEIYLDSIDYTGGNNLSPTNYVKFYYDDTRTDAHAMYNTNFSVITAKLLKTIEVVSNSGTVRAYTLDYTTSGSTSQSIMLSIQQFGNNASLNGNGMVTGGTALPALNANYTSGINGWTNATFQIGGSNWRSTSYNNRIHLGDFNGDGMTDVLLGPDASGNWYMRYSTGAGWTYATFQIGNNWASTSYNNRIHLGDFNGDGMTDVLLGPDASGNWYMRYSTGTGWSKETFRIGGSTWRNRSYNNRIHLGDFNGDGMTDVLLGPDANGNWYMRYSTGAGWSKETFQIGGSTWGNRSYNNRINLGDFNSDGMTDVLLGPDESGNWYMRYSTGAGWSNETFQIGGSTWRNGSYNNRIHLGGFNGDGMTDVLLGPDESGNWYMRYSTGAGWSNETFQIGGSTWRNGSYNNRIHLGDFNGDGMTDVLLGPDESGNWYMRNSTSPLDLLSSFSNGVGGTTTITYKPSSQYENDVFPLILQTVSSISVDDGNGNTSTTDYTYAGGLFDYGTRELRGFEYVKTTDPSGTTSETWFHQDAVFKGLPYKTEIKDSSGNLYSESEKTYGSTSPYTGVDFPYLVQSDDYVYDGTAVAKEISTTFTYDAYGNITEKHLGGNTAIAGDERDDYTEYSYDTANWIVSLPNHTYVNDSAGTKVSEAWFTHDANGNLLTNTTWNDSGTDPVVTYTYDSYGNQNSITDPRGNTTNITYDSTHTFPYQATNPLGHTAITVYDPAFGTVISETNPNGNTTTYDYDVFGRVTKVTNPLDTGSQYGTASYEYQDCGTANLRIITHSTEESGTANHIRSEVCLDGLERTVKTWKDGPDGKTIVADIEYDSTGRVFRKSLPYFDGIETPRWTTYTYDPVGRVTQITNPDGTFVTTSYDKDTTELIDANGHKKVEVKDVYGRLIKVEEYTGTTGSHALYSTTTYEYNALGNLIKLTDTGNNQTTMTYDTLGRKKTMDDPDMGVWSYDYDVNGNLISQTDAKGQTTAFTYDILNRVRRKDYPVGADTIYTYDEPFSTNRIGLLTTLTDSTGNSKYYYDELGRTLKTIKTVDSTSYTTETTYDALGRTKDVTYPDSEKVNYTYDTGGNLLSVTDDVGSTTYASYTGYNALGQINGITYGNGVDTAYTYDPNNNLLKTIDTQTSTGTALINRSYTFDNIGSITNITDNIDATNTQSFTYDALDRLTNATSGNYGSLAYEYDKIGNFNSKRGTTYSYGARPHAVTATSDGKTYIYDDNGNMTSDTNRTITYNYDNKPSSVTIGGESAIFFYDGTGARVKKMTGSSTTIYIGKLYEEKGGNTTKFIFAGGTKIASKTSTDTYYYHQDHLGSSSVITNSNGVKVEEIRYYPFGETLSDDGTVSVSHKYTSQELDIETGLYYYNARYYDPVLGRFISADPIVPDPTNPQALNRYSYVLNNPLKYTDPSGHGFFSRVWRGIRRAVSSIESRIRNRVKDTVKQVTSFSLQNVVNAAIDGGLEYYGIKPNGTLGLTIKAVGNQAVKYASFGAIDGLYKAESPGSYGNHFTDGGTAISASSSGGDNNGNTEFVLELFKETTGYNELKREVNRLGYLLILLGTGYNWANGYGPSGQGIEKYDTRVTRNGDKAVRIERKDGSVLDITPKRVKEWVPNIHPNAPQGALNKVKFQNPIPGTKGFKRVPTRDELELLRRLTG